VSRPAATAGTAADVSSWLTRYREEPSLDRLLAIAGRLCAAEDPAAAVTASGISIEWLQGQGDQVARMSLQAVRDAVGCTLQELRSLRRALSRLGVPCAGWAVSDADIDAALLRYAQGLYQQAVSRMSPAAGWELLRLLADGAVPGLDSVAAGARDVVTGYAVRYVQEDLADGYGDAASTLRQLAAMLPALDPAVRAGFERAGLPGDEAGLEHAAEVIEVRRLWEQHQRREDDDGIVLALACAPVLADGTVRPGEIGTTSEGIWAAARTWVAAQVSRIEGGDHDCVRRLWSFTAYSRLGYGPFGISDAQAADWEQARARDCWARARAGDGRAAFEVILHCEEKGNSYESATGLPASRARAELQAVMNAYAAGLRTQVETAAARKWAKPPFRELRDFASLVRQINDSFAGHSGRHLVETPWDMPRDGWHEFYVRYVRDSASARDRRP
jgi:hypothetical protein